MAGGHWNGITRRASLKDWAAARRDELADAAHAGRWARVLELVQGDGLANVARLEGRSGFTPLHQAAWHGAPREVAEALVERGASRVLRSAEGERAVDLARRMGHLHLVEALEPVLRHRVAAEELAALEAHLHALIRDRAPKLVEDQRLRLPVLEVLLELEEPALWFPVPGMYGGFSLRLEPGARPLRLVSESWCRVVGGSGQRHTITAAGVELTDEGFV